MARLVTIGTLVTRARQRWGSEGDQQLDDPEVKSLISELYGELHAMVSDKGARYFETEATIDLGNLALPSDHLSTIGVDFVLSGTTGPRRPVWGPIGPADRSYLIGLSNAAACFWAEEGASLALYPTPTSGTYKHLYIPQPTDYSTAADGTSVDVINIYGEKFLIWGVASIAQHKGSVSQQRAVDERDRAMANLEYWACQRAVMQPAPYRIPAEVLDALRCGRWRLQ